MCVTDSSVCVTDIGVLCFTDIGVLCCMCVTDSSVCVTDTGVLSCVCYRQQCVVMCVCVCY